jgi:predicted nuclease of predicted toxin-antitoxin system
LALGWVRGPDRTEVKILIDMNLSPTWVEYLAAHNFEAVHWSAVGDPKADDPVIMDYARENAMLVFTHDLDFGNVLAVTHARGPSVIQVRTENPVPEFVGGLLIKALVEHATSLERGALITLEPNSLRARILPIVPGIRSWAALKRLQSAPPPRETTRLPVAHSVGFRLCAPEYLPALRAGEK